MKALTAAEMREVDRQTTARFGIPGLQLMESAGQQVCEVILRWLGGRHAPESRRELKISILVREREQRRGWVGGGASFEGVTASSREFIFLETPRN